MNELNITNEKIRKDLTFNYNGKEFLYSYGKDTLTNNNFTLLHENNKSHDEVLRIYTKEVYDNIVLANSSKIISFPYDYICKSFTDISSQKETCKENTIEAR